MNILSFDNLPELVGKKIRWQANIYKGNIGYYDYGLTGGITIIKEIDISKRSPILKEEKIDEKSDDIIYAFRDRSDNDVLSFSDSDRFISFEII